jgi:NAD(P)-dependent dehydrogenase (short-subunit alcohol dehydrogenase family)
MNAPTNAAMQGSSDKLFELTGQVAIVTGTSRGLGQYFARALAKAGADLVLTSRKRETLAGFAAVIEALGRRVLALDLDVRDEASIRRMAPTLKRPSDKFISSLTMPAAISASPRWK